LTEERRACAVCARILDYSTAEGWLHVIDADDHIPVPVLPEEIRVDERCDFCFDARVTHVLPARTFVINEQSGSSGDWAACDRCAGYIERNQWSALTRWSAESFQQRHGFLPSRTGLSRIHRLLRKNITGPLRPYKLSGGRQ